MTPITFRGRKSGRDVEIVYRPPLMNFKYTAAQIAARWSEENNLAMMECRDVDASKVLGLIWETENSLDEGCAFSDIMTFSPGASSDEVYDGGDGLNMSASWTADTWASSLTAASYVLHKLNDSDSGFYIGVSGDAAPTTGIIRLQLEVMTAK